MALHGRVFSATAESPLRFDRARAAQTVQGMSCTACAQTMRDIYFETGGSVICASCRDAAAARSETLGDGGRFMRSVGYGLVGAASGAAVYAVFRAVTGMDVAMVLLFVGFAVGRAVRYGSGEIGGARYQLLAVMLTYVAAVASHVPVALAQPVQPSPLQLLVTLPVVGAPPSILVAVSLPITLMYAWRLNRRMETVVTGPYRIAASGPAPARANRDLRGPSRDPER